MDEKDEKAIAWLQDRMREGVKAKVRHLILEVLVFVALLAICVLIGWVTAGMFGVLFLLFRPPMRLVNILAYVRQNRAQRKAIADADGARCDLQCPSCEHRKRGPIRALYVPRKCSNCHEKVTFRTPPTQEEIAQELWNQIP